MFPLNSLWTRLPAAPLIKLSRTAPTMMRRLRTVGKAREAGVNCYSYDTSGTYSSWTDCTCAGEQLTQSRTWECDDPASSECPGSHVEAGNCTIEDCPVRLVGGNGVSSGNVFAINGNGFNGPVCDNGWTDTAATVVCK